MMYTFLFLTILFLPIFNAERIPIEMNDKENFLMRRSVAASYLGLPIRRPQYRLFDSSVFPSSSDSDDQYQQQAQRHKRIYWENLAFHAADYNQKPKKV